MKRLSTLLGLSLATSVPATAETYLCFGDSITFGANGTSTDAYLGALSGYLGTLGESASMVPAGLPGENTAAGKDRLDGLLGSSTADTVLIMQGTNDVFSWVLRPDELSPDDTRANLADMVRAVRTSGKGVVLATVPPRVLDGLDPDNELTEDLNDLIRSVAVEKGVRLAEVYNNLKPVANLLIYRDSLHPDSLGYPLVAEAFAAAITSTGIETIDLAGPLPTDASPFPSTSGNSVAADIELTVRELRSQVDTAGAVMTVNGATVVPVIEAVGTGTVRFRHTFPERLNFGQTINVSLDVPDTSVPVNRTTFTYSWKTSSGNGTGGDLDKSGRVDGKDLAVLSISFGSKTGEARYRFRADIDANGVVDGTDLSIVGATFGTSP